MARRFLLAALSLSLTLPWFSPSPPSAYLPAAHAQEAMWNTFMKEGMMAFGKGNYQEAEKLLTSALKSAEEEPTVKAGQRCVIMEMLSLVLLQENKYAEAEANYKKELAVCEKEYGAGSVNAAMVVASLAGVYSGQRQYPEAEALLTKAIGMATKTEGGDSTTVAGMLSSLADLYGKQKKYAEAETTSLRAQKIYETKLGPTDVKVVQCMLHRGIRYEEQIRYTEATKLLKDALAINEKARGADNDQNGPLLDFLAILLIEQGKYAEALPLTKRALAINEKEHGVDTLFSLNSLNCLVTEYDGMGSNVAEADAINDRVLKAVEGMFGPNHASMVVPLRNKAKHAWTRREFAQAQLIYDRVLKIQQNTPGIAPSSLVSSMNDLAAAYRATENYIDAESMYRDVLAKDQERLGFTDPAIAADLDNLSRVLAAQGKQAEADKLSRQSLVIKKALPGSSKLVEPEKKSAAPAAGTGTGATASATAEDTTGTQVKVGRSADLNRPVKDKWAVVVGISSFEDPELNLKYAAKDATDFRNYLVGEAHFQPDHVKLLTNEQATHDNIVNALGTGWLGRVAKPDDLVVIYMSSHGSAPSDTAKGSNLIVTYETSMDNLELSGIPMQWLTGSIKKMVHCDRTVLVLDVCHAGAVKSDEQKGLARTAAASPFNVDGVVLGKGQVLIASSDADQVSWESRTSKNGVFTYRLLEGLRQQGDKTSLANACTYLREKVEEEVLRDRAKLQTPVIIKNWDGDDVILGVIPSSPRAGLDTPAKEASASSP